MKTVIVCIAFVIVWFGNISVMPENNLEMDKDHSKLEFIAKHFGVTHVQGNFKSFEAKLKSEKSDFTDAVIEMTAETKSLYTGVEMRDKDLRSSNFFDVEKYPTIVFKSTSFKKTEGNKYLLTGNITIHGITKPITYNVVYNGRALNPISKKYSIGFTVTGKLNRKDFEVGSGPTSAAIGDEIELRSDVEFLEN